jgi:hypothetical protein
VEPSVVSVTGGAGRRGDVEVAFDARVSGADDAALLWDFGDGSPREAGPSPVHRYARQGDYEVTVFARGEGGRGGDARATFTAHAGPFGFASASFERVSDASSRGPLRWRHSAKAAWGREPYEYAWSFGDGGASTEADGVREFAEPGEYQVTVTATDSEGKTVTKDFGRVRVPPFALLLEADPGGGPIPALVTFRAKVYDVKGGELPPEAAARFRFAWDFGEGPRDPSQAGQVVRHRYDALGEPVRDAAGRETGLTRRKASVSATGEGGVALAATLLVGGLGLSLGVVFLRGRGGRAGLNEAAEG